MLTISRMIELIHFFVSFKVLNFFLSELVKLSNLSNLREQPVIDNCVDGISLLFTDV